jgi:hypothetical protein
VSSPASKGSELEDWGAATRKWIDAGHQYRIPPSNGMVITAAVLLAMVGAGLGGATLSGLSVNPAPLGYVFGAAVVLIPAGLIVLVILYRLNAYLFVDSAVVGRTGLFGRVVTKAPRSTVIAVAVRKGSRSERDENAMCLVLAGGRVTMTTKMYLYRPRQAEKLSAVLGVPFKTGA